MSEAAPARPRRRWLWLLLLVPCVPCCGLCGLSASSKSRADRERAERAKLALEKIEAFRADAGVVPAGLRELGVAEEHLVYEACPDGGFSLAWVEAGIGVFPSDFARQFDPATRQWELRELGAAPPCGEPPAGGF